MRNNGENFYIISYILMRNNGENGTFVCRIYIIATFLSISAPSSPSSDDGGWWDLPLSAFGLGSQMPNKSEFNAILGVSSPAKKKTKQKKQSKSLCYLWFM